MTMSGVILAEYLTLLKGCSMNLKDFSVEEKEILNCLRKNGLNSTWGALKMLAFAVSFGTVMVISMICFYNGISVPYGYQIGELSLWLGVLISFRQFYLIHKYENQFLTAFAKRTGLKFSKEPRGSQFYNEETKTYIKIIFKHEDILITETKIV